MNKINKRIKYRRMEGNYTQHDIAKVLNKKNSTYAQQERTGNFNGEELVILADFFGVDVRTFLYDNIPEPQPPRTIVIDETPDDCYRLTSQEVDLLTLYQNLSKEKQKAVFKFAYEKFKERKKHLL